MCIVFSHSFYLSGNASIEPLLRISNNKFDFSYIGLQIFFSISGFLIAKSALTSSSYKNYLWKRLLRIQPLLVVVTIVSIIVGTFFSTLSITSYFTEFKTYTYLRNIFPAFGIQFLLPQVFTNNIAESGVNGSLWTLVVEERLYIVMLLFWIFKRNSNIVLLLTITFLNFIHCFNQVFAQNTVFNYFDTVSIFYSTVFLNAAYFYVAKINFEENAKKYATISLALLILLGCFNQINLLGTIIIPFFIVSLAHCNFKSFRFFQFADYTYGLYIFSFPVQQMLCYKKQEYTNPYTVFVITIAIVLPLAMMSWHFFESKILNYKNWVK